MIGDIAKHLHAGAAALQKIHAPAPACRASPAGTPRNSVPTGCPGYGRCRHGRGGTIPAGPRRDRTAEAPRAASPATSTLSDRLALPAIGDRRAAISSGSCGRMPPSRLCVISDLRIGEDRPDRAFLDDAAGVDHSDPVGDRADHLHLVGDQQDGQAEPAVDVLEQRQDGAGGFRIERRGRLVREQQRRSRRQRAGDADALLLAARQRRRDRLSPFPTGRRGRAVRRRASAVPPSGVPRSSAAARRCPRRSWPRAG